MKLVLAFLAGVLVAIGLSGRAEDWAVSTVRSYHMERKGYEEQNYGLGIETDATAVLRIALGFYRNSERRDSLYAAGVLCPLYLRYGSWRGCGLVGGVSGYDKTVAPLAGLVLSYEQNEWGWNLILFPDGKGDFSQGVVAAQIKRRF